MKRIIILFAILFISTILVAQTQTLTVPNGYITNNTLCKFEGTWQWVNGTDTVKIILKKDKVLLPSPENSYADFLIGFHLYKKGNVVVESSIMYSNTTYSAKHSTILGGNNEGNNKGSDTLSGTLKDLSKNKLAKLRLILNSSRTQLQWSLDNLPGLKIGPFDRSFTLPKVLTLMKQ